LGQLLGIDHAADGPGEIEAHGGDIDQQLGVLGDREAVTAADQQLLGDHAVNRQRRVGALPQQQTHLDVPAPRAQRLDLGAGGRGERSASRLTCAPPPVRSRTCAAMSGPEGRAVAPRASAALSAAGETSTAHISAPAASAIITQARPSPPQPKTTTLSPGRTAACARTAWWAVPTRQPSPAARVMSIPSGRATRL